MFVYDMPHVGCDHESLNITPFSLILHSQVITADEMVSRVSDLTSLSTFGFSLQGSVDVDNNRYQGALFALLRFHGNQQQTTHILHLRWLLAGFFPQIL